MTTPYAVDYVQPVVNTALLGKALDSLLNRQAKNVQARKFYEGTVEEVFASYRMRRAMARAGIGFNFNFAKTPVDAVTDRLEVAGIRSGNGRANDAIAEMWADNQLDLEMPNVFRRTGEYGDGYLMVWPRAEDDMALGEEIEGLPTRVGIYYNDSDTVQLFYSDENPLEKAFAIKRWKTDEGYYRVDLLFPDRIERYITKTRQSDGDKALDFDPLVIDYEVLVGEDNEPVSVPVWPAENPFGEVPVFHFRNDRPYGVPEHQGFYGPQNAINKLLIAHMSGVDYQSFPQRYALMATDSDTSEAADLDEDDFDFAGPGPNGQSETSSVTGEGRSQLSAHPGSVWFMRGVEGVGQFDTAKPDVFLDPMERYLRFGAQITTTPLRMFDYETAQQPSGASQQAADGPFAKKVRNRQLSYGATLQDVFQFALRVYGIVEEDVAVLWAPPEVVNDVDGWSVIAMKLDAGVPFDQVMIEAGYMKEQVDSWPTPPARPAISPVPPVPTPRQPDN